LKVEILSRQITALQTQLDTKTRDFFEYTAKELQELQDCGKLDEVDCFFFSFVHYFLIIYKFSKHFAHLLAF
jgi:hypothetical protein